MDQSGAERRRPQRGMSEKAADQGTVGTARDGAVAVLTLDRPGEQTRDFQKLILDRFHSTGGLLQRL